MKVSSVAVLAVVSASPFAVSGFAPPTANQRQFASAKSKNTPSIKSSSAINTSTTSRYALSMGFGEALLGASLGLATTLSVGVAPTSTVNVPDGPSITIAKTVDEIANSAISTQSPSALKDAEKLLLKEVKAAEKEAKADAKKAELELRKTSFFEYEAKKAADDEARIEAAEQKFAEEAKKDEEEVQRLLAAEKKAEEEVAKATSKEEKAEKLAEAKKLAREEKAAERKEKKAERAERLFLAEETQEKKTLDAKAEAALAEETKFAKVEKEYEKVLAREEEEEAELKAVKEVEAKIGLTSAKKR